MDLWASDHLTPTITISTTITIEPKSYQAKTTRHKSVSAGSDLLIQCSEGGQLRGTRQCYLKRGRRETSFVMFGLLMKDLEKN